MPSAHFQDFDPEVVEPEPPAPEVQRAMERPSSEDEPKPVQGND